MPFVIGEGIHAQVKMFITIQANFKLIQIDILKPFSSQLNISNYDVSVQLDSFLWPSMKSMSFHLTLYFFYFFVFVS